MSNIKKVLNNIGFFYAILIGVVYTPIVIYLSAKMRGMPLLGPIQFFTSDTFYYLSIARHSAEKAFYTSDGTLPTNGFHPLWGFTLTKLFEIPKVAGDSSLQIYLAFGISLILVSIGMLFFGFTAYKLTDNFAISFLATVPGFYYLIFSPTAPNFNSTWSFINGMESPFSILFFGLLLYLLVVKRTLLPPSFTAIIIPILITTLMIFSRLDDVFFLVPFLMLILLFSNSKRNAFLRLAISAGAPFFAISAYLLYNYSYAGSALPVSGAIKQGNWLFVNLISFFSPFIPAGLINFNPIWSDTSMRALQMCIPALFAFIWLFNLARKDFAQSSISMNSNSDHLSWRKLFSLLRQTNSEQRENYLKDYYDQIILAALALYVLLKGTYNFIFVYLTGQGHWYYPVSIMIFNLLFAILISSLFREHLAKGKGIILGTISIALALMIANSFIHHKIFYNYNTAYYKFWTNRETINEDLIALDPNIKIVEYDDGIMAYSIDIPTMSGLGFTLDREGYKAQYTGHLLELAYNRGFHVIGAMSYINFPLNIENDSDKLREALRKMPGITLENLDQWEFKILYKDPVSTSMFILFEPIR